MIFLDKEMYNVIVVVSDIKRNVLDFVRRVIHAFNTLNSKNL